MYTLSYIHLCNIIYSIEFNNLSCISLMYFIYVEVTMDSRFLCMGIMILERTAS